jgi:flagellin
MVLTDTKAFSLPFVSFTLIYEETAMTWSINTNNSSLYAQQGLATAQSGLSKTIQSLSTGLRVNSAADDPAGYAISIKMTGNINGMNQAVRNANDGVSLVQTAASALTNITGALQSMRTLAVQAASGTYSSTDTGNLQSEFSALASEINSIASSTSFNGNALFSGASSTSGVQIQIGADTQGTSQLTISSGALAAMSTIVGLTSNTVSGASVSAAIGVATTALGAIDTALSSLSSQQALLGAYQIQLTTVVSNLQSNVTNTSAAKGQIEDVDYAATTASLSRQQILQQASTAMLAQANQSNQGVMQLLR